MRQSVVLHQRGEHRLQKLFDLRVEGQAATFDPHVGISSWMDMPLLSVALRRFEVGAVILHNWVGTIEFCEDLYDLGDGVIKNGGERGVFVLEEIGIRHANGAHLCLKPLM